MECDLNDGEAATIIRESSFRSRLPLRDVSALRIDAPGAGMRSGGISPLDRKRVPRDTVELARFLLGKIVVREIGKRLLAGRIVETEAYLEADPACHAFRGMTPRNRSLFLEAGHAYVYLCYGTSFMLNVSSEAPGIGSGVLLRALEPLSGIEHMRRARGVGNLRDLARGPGRLAAALERRPAARRTGPVPPGKLVDRRRRRSGRALSARACASASPRPRRLG